MDRQHKCALCPYSTKKLNSYKRHLTLHSTDKPFKCPESPYKTKEKGNVKIHAKNVHAIFSRPFPCPHSGCSYAAKNKSTINKHSKVHSDEKPFSCSRPNCNFSTNQKANLMRHTQTHTGGKPFVCQFESCSYAAAQLGHLERHSRTHTKEKPFKCPEPNCEYEAADNISVEKHQLGRHPVDGEERPTFSCPLCAYISNQNSNLFRHIKTHTLEKFFKCDHPNCNFEAKTKREVKSHKVVHSDEKRFACSFESCEFRCKLKRVLDAHLKTHSEERRYKCELCPFRGKTRTAVLHHIKNIHSDPKFRPFKCTDPQCDYSSNRKGDLNEHLLTHGGEKKYSCSFPLCDYKAILPKMIRAHQNTVHETEKKFKCRLCAFATKTNARLTIHMRIHTKETPYILKRKDANIGQEEKRSKWTPEKKTS